MCARSLPSTIALLDAEIFITRITTRLGTETGITIVSQNI